MFGYCCKCNEGTSQYYGGQSGRSGSGGGLYFNPYGVGGGCDVCPTVPFAWNATITSAGGCPCTGYGGTVQLQHVSGPYTYGVNYFSLVSGSGAPCDVWASSERALRNTTCVAQTYPRYEILLWSDGGIYNWYATWLWQIGLSIRTTYCSLGTESGSTCFDDKTRQSGVTSDGIPACVFTEYDITPA